TVLADEHHAASAVVVHAMRRVPIHAKHTVDHSDDGLHVAHHPAICAPSGGMEEEHDRLADEQLRLADEEDGRRAGRLDIETSPFGVLGAVDRALPRLHLAERPGRKRPPPALAAVAVDETTSPTRTTAERPTSASSVIASSSQSRRANATPPNASRY